MTQQKPTFQEVRNNILHLFILVFIGFFFACGQKKNENKAVDNQGDTTKIRYYRDSVFWALQKLQHIKDTNHIYTSINSVKNIEIANDKLLFVYVDNFTVMADFALQKDCYVLRWNDKQWQVIDSIKFAWIPNVSETIDTVQLADVDFDGQQEIVLRFSSVSGSRGIYPYELFKYDATKQSLRYFLSLETSLDEIILNHRAKTIMLGTDGGVFSQYKEVYTWVADSLQIQKSIISYENGKGCRNVIKEQKFKNGVKSKLKKTTFTNCDKAWDYFEKWQ